MSSRANLQAESQYPAGYFLDDSLLSDEQSTKLDDDESLKPFTGDVSPVFLPRVLNAVAGGYTQLRQDLTLLVATRLLVEDEYLGPLIRDCCKIREFKRLRLVRNLQTSAMKPSLTQNVDWTTGYAQRRKMCENIEQMLEDSRVIQIRGPSASGKTVLLRLLERHLQKSHPDARVYWQHGWPKDDQLSLAPLQNRTSLPKFPAVIEKMTYILCDNAQAAYGVTPLWALVKNHRGYPNLRLVLACQYGSHESFRDAVPTPFSLPPCSVVTLWNTGDEDGGLLLTEEDYQDLLRRRLDRMHLTDEVRDVIFQISSGYVGVIDWFLKEILRKHKESQTCHIKYTLEQFHDQFSPHYIGKFFSGSVNGPGLPRYDQLSAPDNQDLHPMFCQLLRDNFILKDMTNTKMAATIDKAHNEGWIYLVSPYQYPQKYVMASPLHASWLSWILSRQDQDLPHATIQDLLYAVLAKIQLSKIYAPYSSMGSSALHVETAECMFEAAFYRALHDVTHGSVCISPEFANGMSYSGRLDFLIPSKKWGFELMREGSKLQEHADRFSSAKVNGSMRDAGDLDQYLLVDCRTTTPQKDYPGIPSLYYAIFSFETKVVKVLDHELRELEQIALLEH